jgi:transaldolase/glucose-6-phosphate isomerase
VSLAAGSPGADNALGEIRARGQAVWLNGMRRRLVDSGRLSELMDTMAVSGVATDLGALTGAVARGGEYAEPLLGLRETDSHDVPLERLLAEEAAITAAPLRPLYEQSGGSDGLVSVDVDLSRAHDAEGMARAARRLLAEAEAPNVVAKLPPTSSGFAVFEALVADGVHVHVGPLFSIASVLRATEAFLRGTDGGSERTPVAVVSFGLAAIDNLIDQMLQREIRAAGRDMSRVESLIGGAATAMAKVAWGRQGERMAAAGADPAARRLRLAWVDLSSPDPRQPREHYVERLVGPGTIAVLDTPLLASLARRADIDTMLDEGVDQAEEVIAELAELGIDTEEVGGVLEARVVRRARALYAELATRVDVAARALAADQAGASRRASTGTRWSAATVEIEDDLVRCDELEERRGVARLWAKDASLWSDDDDTRDLVRNRLGWLDAAASGSVDPEPLLGFAAELEEAEVENVVLLGMGGSSLTTEVCRRVFDSERVHVLDSTVPGQIEAVGGRVDPARTAVLVASKSGSTIEVRALFDWFYALATPMLDKPGDRFAAITDPGTPLEQLAHERGFARLWLAPADVGGRFSALTVFGTLPMAVMGVDVHAVLAAARRMASACSPEVAVAANPAARLAAALHRAWQAKRDKITFVASPSLSAFGLWAEQLIAESTGKQGRGLIPVVAEPAVDIDHYGDDRIFIALSRHDEPGDRHRALVETIAASDHPLLRFELEDPHELGAEFFRWEAAVALLGALMGINPFDQPDVQAAKDRTAALLAAHRNGTPMSDRPPLATDTGWAVFADIERDEELARRQHGEGLASWLAAHLGRAAPPEYVGLQAFVASTAETRAALQGLRTLLVERLGVATTLGWGPAFLHSTGQLHKGGPDSGLFLQITADDDEDIDVPGAGYSFGRLARAQSLGDLAALQERGRRVLRVHLRDAVNGCRELLEAAEHALG